ncbi:MAG: TylF/MycF/NovP-related O-methyltransferase [Planctomycetota bacterium]
MAQKHERMRQEHDRLLDERLESEEFRAEHWDDLGAEGARDSLVHLLESTLALEGDVIECGVYRGASLFRMARRLKTLGSDKELYACDSFEGFPTETVGKLDTSFLRPVSKLRRKFTGAGDVPERIERFCGYYDTPIRVVKGFFSDTLPALTDRRFCFIHLDVDLYQSYVDCLTLLYPCLAPGGVVVFDDYNPSKLPGVAKWPGATLAVNEFFADRPESVERCETRDRPAWFVRKAAVSAQRVA